MKINNKIRIEMEHCYSDYEKTCNSATNVITRVSCIYLFRKKKGNGNQNVTSLRKNGNGNQYVTRLRKKMEMEISM